jgi:hypothetical protein
MFRAGVRATAMRYRYPQRVCTGGLAHPNVDLRLLLCLFNPTIHLGQFTWFAFMISRHLSVCLK